MEDGVFLVEDSAQETVYTVNAKSGICSCCRGADGTRCKHQQLLCERNLVRDDQSSFLGSSLQERTRLYWLATGRSIELLLVISSMCSNFFFIFNAHGLPLFQGNQPKKGWLSDLVGCTPEGNGSVIESKLYFL